ncbi:MAG: hypothetical protein NC293_03600 [Roseburia sp.]|nr:hypothetical protein [Roseburia sp.]
MLKKIRCFYWKQRDRGRGRVCITGFALLAICLAVLASWMFLRLHFGFDGEEAAGVVSGGAITGASVSGMAVSGGAVSEPVVQKTTPDAESQSPIPEIAPAEYELDTDGLRVFLGFMTDTSYDIMVSALETECEKEQALSVTKMEYQKTSTKSSNVTSYVLSDVGSVYQVVYNLKSDSVAVTKSQYSESDVISLKKEADKKEQDRLKKEREKTKKKQTAKKKKGKTKKKKTYKDVG